MNDFAWFLIIILLLLISGKIGAHYDEKLKKDHEDFIKDIPIEKSCPPHSWEWEEQLDMLDTTYIRCQKCRRLPGWPDK
jgi:hypothetical protein